MPSTPASIATDLTMPLIPTLITSHSFAYVTPPSAGITASVEIPVTTMWPPGFALAQNKLTTTVLHKAMPIALDGHNCGYMIVHVTLPPAPFNTLLPIQILFSSRKMAFSSSKVKANSAQVANTFPVFLPMMCCANPMSLPTGCAITNIANNVIIGLTWLDVLVGFVAIIATMVLEWFTRSTPKIPSLTSYLEKFFFPLSKKNWIALAVKTAVGVATGLARILITGEGSISIKVGSDYAGAGISFAKTADGQWSIAVGGQVGGPVTPFGTVAGAQGKYQYTSNPDGSSSSAWSGSTAEGQPVLLGGAAARQSASSTNTTAADGRVSNKTSTSHQEVAAEPGFGAASTSQTTTTTPAGKPSSTKTTGYSGGRALGETWGKPL